MMGVTGQPPTITHTAATPQDSPNTTLDTGYRDINCRTIYQTNLSIESIDRTSVSQLNSTRDSLPVDLTPLFFNNKCI